MKFLSNEEFETRQAKLQNLIKENGFDALLISSNANIYYATGMVFAGYVYVPAEGTSVFLIRRPVGIDDCRAKYIRKPEQILEILSEMGLKAPTKLAMEADRAAFSTIQRLAKALNQTEIINGSPILSKARSVKTEYEIKLLKESGVRHTNSYKRIYGKYESGMTDVELQIEIERILRLDGCLGIFRINGESMELFMGNLLAGDNADTPTPYDFAMGGEGLDNSLPVGCNGTVIRPDNTIMVDMNGNFTGYMTDMTRTFYVERVSDLAKKAHLLSIDINHKLMETMKPGTKACDAYMTAQAMVEEAGLTDYFMGHNQKAGFVGHGVGIEVNEMPVIAPKSRDILELGNVIALEPKFVIPGVGAVGVENTYIVRENGLECITTFPEELTQI